MRCTVALSQQQRGSEHSKMQGALLSNGSGQTATWANGGAWGRNQPTNPQPCPKLPSIHRACRAASAQQEDEIEDEFQRQPPARRVKSGLRIVLRQTEEHTLDRRG